MALVTKRGLSDGASAWAQGEWYRGGTRPADSLDDHERETHTAGAGLCDTEATRFVVEHGREAIEWLILRKGVPFRRTTRRRLATTSPRRPGQSHRRIIHAADATGAAVQQTLCEQVLAHPNISVFETTSVDLIVGDKIGRPEEGCLGAYAGHRKRPCDQLRGAPHRALPPGLGQGPPLHHESGHRDGDGIAMAWRAGCRVTNMEFIQFHPTCLYHPQAKSFLISEAVRGEGGILRAAR